MSPAAVARRLRREQRPLRFLASRALWRSGLCRWLTYEAHGVRLRFHPSALSASLWLDPSDRADDVAALRALLRPGDTYVDVGANVGMLALVAARIAGPSGRVVAIEPHPRVFAYLAANLRLNGCDHALALNCAAGERRGELRFSDRRTDDQNAVSDDGGLTVPVARLDDLLSRVEGRVRLLKIDVEGFEKHVLEGAARTLERTDAVYFESWDRHFARYGDTGRDVIGILERAGFTVLRRESGQSAARATSAAAPEPDRPRSADRRYESPGAVLAGYAPVPPGYTSAERENLLAMRAASTASMTRS